MNERNLKQTAQKHVPKQNKGKQALIAFVSGGCMGIFGQLLMLFYQNFCGFSEKNAVAPMIVTIILITAILTGLGLFDKMAQICGAGLFIPISGFANSLTASAMEGRSEGPIYGIGGNMFKLAGSVLTYGIAAAFIFGMIRYVLFGG